MRSTEYDPIAEAPSILEMVADYNRRNINLDIEKAALLVIDMQVYFASPGGGAYMPQAGMLIPSIKALSDYFRDMRRPIIFTRHGHDEEGSDTGLLLEWWSDYIRRDTQGWELVDGIGYSEGDTIIDKNRYDAFLGTALEDILRGDGIRDIVLTGVMANLCVETTARSAFVRGFRPFVPADAVATATLDLHRAAFLNLAYGFAKVVTVDEIIKGS
ncbi:MAG: cysteine hydrolase [bacterium]|nr:cysteine hydrolase [bacterium]